MTLTEYLYPEDSHNSAKDEVIQAIVRLYNLSYDEAERASQLLPKMVKHIKRNP